MTQQEKNQKLFPKEQLPLEDELQLNLAIEEGIGEGLDRALDRLEKERLEKEFKEKKLKEKMRSNQNLRRHTK